jgi:hypothetical protein
VRTNDSIVARFGSSMPTPLATPTTVASPARARRTLGRVSVVMIAAATASASRSGSCTGIPCRPGRMRSIGYWRAMTPVDAMSSSSAPRPTADATARRTSVAFSRPWRPVATFALRASTRNPRPLPAADAARLRSTLGPANRDLV